MTHTHTHAHAHTHTHTHTPIYHLSIDATFDDISCGVGLIIGLKVSLPPKSEVDKRCRLTSQITCCQRANNLKFSVKLNQLSEPRGGKFPLGVVGWRGSIDC